MTSSKLTDDFDAQERLADELYQQIRLSPPEEIDAKLRAKIRREVDAKPKRRVTVSAVFRYSKIPLSLAAGLILGILLNLTTFYDHATPTIPNGIQFMGDPKRTAAEFNLDEQPPEAWLDTIAELYMERRVADAETLYLTFKHKFPDYRPEP